MKRQTRFRYPGHGYSMVHEGIGVLVDMGSYPSARSMTVQIAAMLIPRNTPLNNTWLLQVTEIAQNTAKVIPTMRSTQCRCEPNLTQDFLHGDQILTHDCSLRLTKLDTYIKVTPSYVLYLHNS